MKRAINRRIFEIVRRRQASIFLPRYKISSFSRVSCSGASLSGSFATSIMADVDNRHLTNSADGSASNNCITEVKLDVGTSSSTVPDGYEQIVEGQAKMIYKRSLKREQEVFYNPVQVQNRDLSILMLSLYAERRHDRNLKKKGSKKRSQEVENEKTDVPEEPQHIMNGSNSSLVNLLNQTANSDGLRILEALAASGLRSIRYSKEVPGVREIIVNDIDPAAVGR
jgi:hypothetical protein